MLLSEFDYFLPKELIAQEGLNPRDESKLLVLHPSGKREHLFFKDLPQLLSPGDLLVLNDTQVSRTKLMGRKESGPASPTGGGKVDCLILSGVLSCNGVADALIRGSNIKSGTRIIFRSSAEKRETLHATVLEKVGRARFKIRFEEPSLVEQFAELPLPPYIKKKQKDPARYQTVYARKTGSLAAPTAGLHFTPQLMEQLKQKGIDFAYLTLHIGIGTFAPIRSEIVEDWKMHSEYFEIAPASLKKIKEAIKNKKRIFAVGTTTIRALESSARGGELSGTQGWTDLFIVPGYKFRFPYAGLITNFHLPKSTLLLLVCAFGGKERIFSAYQEAIEKRYRFYSFGDAMLILQPDARV